MIIESCQFPMSNTDIHHMATHYIYFHYLCCLASKNKLWLKRYHVIYNIPMHAETVKMLNNSYIFTKIVHAILVYIVHKFRDLVKGIIEPVNHVCCVNISINILLLHERSSYNMHINEFFQLILLSTIY